MKEILMLVDDVVKDSIADELQIKKGDKILSINEQKPEDIIEYSFLINDEEITLVLERPNGEIEEIEIEKEIDEDLGIIFSSAVFDGTKKCQNHCIFCFVDQQPKGMRDSLYIKDDDWRLSYIQGTYVTLTNLRDADWERIEKFHISPLFVSIHTTNPTLREKMTRNPRAGAILEQLKRFKKIKTKIHAQIVLCPGFNDGAELKRTLEDLKKFKSIVKSIAIVPLGISKYRVEKFKKVDKKIALETIRIVDEFNNSIKKQIAMVSDEFFLLAGLDVPLKKYYGDFLQIEDGVGAIRLLKDSFYKNLKKLPKKIKNKSKITIATASAAAKIFREFQREIKIENLTFDVLEVKNNFFGSDINVAGLITGADLIAAIENYGKIENLILPCVMFQKNGENFDEIFLDGKKLDDVRKINDKMKIHVLSDCYGFDEIAKIIKNL